MAASRALEVLAVVEVVVEVEVPVDVLVEVAVEVSDGWVRAVVDPVATGGTDVVATSVVAELVAELVVEVDSELVAGALVSDITGDVGDVPAVVADPAVGTSPELQALSTRTATIESTNPPRRLMSRRYADGASLGHSSTNYAVPEPFSQTLFTAG